MLGTLDQRYDVQDVLGQGGMAIVYRGFDRRLRRDVAIKVLRPELRSSTDIVKSFHREAEAISKLSHPNIVSIYDYGELDDGRMFMVIELLRGQSLLRLIEENVARNIRMPWRRVVAIATQVCAALTAAHARGIVHHDITPGNIFCLTGEGIRGEHVKVLDFGIAKIAELTQTHSLAGVQAGNGEANGTPFYMAPEVLKPGTPVDHRIDIYALGVVMYELCTGKRPFSGPNLFALLFNIVNADPVAPTSANPDADLDEAAERVILAAMASDPAARPATADLLAKALEATIDDRPRPERTGRVALPPDPALFLGETLLQVVTPITPVVAPAPTSAPPATAPTSTPSVVAPAPATIPATTTSAAASVPAAPVSGVAAAAATPATPPATPPATVTAAASVGAPVAEAEPAGRSAPEATNPRTVVPETTISTAQANRSRWRAGLLGLGLGGAVVFAVVKLTSRPFGPEFSEGGAPTKPDGPVEPEAVPSTPEKSEPAPVDTTAELRSARKQQLGEALTARKGVLHACLKKKSVMRGVGYVMPVVVQFSADGRATASLDEQPAAAPTGEALPEKGHACVLAVITEVSYAPAAQAVVIQTVVPID